MKLSIRYKILAVLSALLLLAIGLYTLLASSIFIEEKTALLYDLNHSLAINSAAQLESSLRRVSDQLKLYSISRIVADVSSMHLPTSYVLSSGVVAAQLYKKERDDFVQVRLPADVPQTQIDFVKLKALLEEADANKFVFWKHLVQEQMPRYFLASQLVVELADNSDSYVAVAELDGRRFFEPVQVGGLFDLFVYRASGDLLFHADHGKVLTPVAFTNHPILNHTAPSVETNSKVQRFEFNNQKWYGAVAPVGISDLYVLSQASHAEVTSAITTLINRSLLFGLIVLTTTFIASIIFSRRLTRGLTILTDSAGRIGQGDLQSTIQLSTGDEVETLATSFNSMVAALRQSRQVIEEHNRELEQKVALRTAQLRQTNAAIKEVQEKLLLSTQLATIGEVAGRTAHELLNPLTAILGRIERSANVLTPSSQTSTGPARQIVDILTAWETDFKRGGLEELMRSLSEPSPIVKGQSLFEEDLENLKKLTGFWLEQSQIVGQDLGFVRTQAQRIHRIIDQMREYVRSSVKSKVHCHEAVDQAIQTMTDYIAKQGASLHCKLMADRDIALLNQDELVQIITNLIRNSMQAIEHRKTTGSINVLSTRTGNIMTIDITDNGQGIAVQDQWRIFDQGFTTKPPSEGTGLGLAICRRYARAFGGEVELLFSEPDGRGTCFRITIPLTESDTDKTDKFKQT